MPSQPSHVGVGSSPRPWETGPGRHVRACAAPVVQGAENLAGSRARARSGGLGLCPCDEPLNEAVWGSPGEHSAGPRRTWAGSSAQPGSRRRTLGGEVVTQPPGPRYRPGAVGQESWARAPGGQWCRASQWTWRPGQRSLYLLNPHFPAHSRERPPAGLTRTRWGRSSATGGDPDIAPRGSGTRPRVRLC